MKPSPTNFTSYSRVRHVSTFEAVLISTKHEDSGANHRYKSYGSPTVLVWVPTNHVGED